MSLLTVFTAPKPFKDPHISIIQRNALQSWLALAPDVDVLLIGNEEGMTKVSTELGVKHLNNVKCNDLGTPLISSIFDLARRNSDSPLLAYVNADIILMSDFLLASRQLEALKHAFLMVGRRWNLGVRHSIQYSSGWEDQLRTTVREQGELFTPYGIDYFVFPRDQYAQLPDFAVGRAGWDNWMIYHARAQRWKVVDATPSIMAIHQNHDYSHLPGGQPHYRLEESQQNVRLAGGRVHMYNTLDTNFEFRNGKLRRPRLSLVRLLRAMERLLLTEKQHGWRWWFILQLRHTQLGLIKKARS